MRNMPNWNDYLDFGNIFIAIVENEDILWCVSPNYLKFKIFKVDIVEYKGFALCIIQNNKN